MQICIRIQTLRRVAAFAAVAAVAFCSSIDARAAVIRDVTTLTISSSSTTPAFTSYNATAAMSPVAATGSILFEAGPLSCLATVIAGAASCAIPFTLPNTYTLNATFIPSVGSNYGASSASPVQLVVTLASSSVTVAHVPEQEFSTNTPIVISAQFSTLNPAPTGSLSFSDNGVILTDCAATIDHSGNVSCSLFLKLLPGQHSITASYSGDGATSPSQSSPQNVVIDFITTSIDVEGNPGEAKLGTTIELIATTYFSVNILSGTGGTVTFGESGTPFPGCNALSIFSSNCRISPLPAGKYHLDVTYSGDIYTAPSALSLPLTIDPPDSNTSLSSDLNSPAIYGQPLTLTATVSGASPTLTGTVTFWDGGSAVQGCAGIVLNANAAQCEIATPAVGSHDFYVYYSGDDTNGFRSQSPDLDMLINKASTTTTLTLPHAAVAAGTPALIGASVSPVAPGGGVPTGTVNVTDGVGDSCTIILPATQCALRPSAGLYSSITGQYVPGGNYLGSTGQAPALSVTPATTLTTSCMTTFTDNEPFTATATVGGSSLTGTVAFSSGNQTLCSNVALAADRTATCTTSTLVAQVGNLTYPYALLATYSGDVTNASNQSNDLFVTLLSAADVLFRNNFEPVSASCPLE